MHSLKNESLSQKYSTVYDSLFVLRNKRAYCVLPFFFFFFKEEFHNDPVNLYFVLAGWASISYCNCPLLGVSEKFAITLLYITLISMPLKS